MTHLYATLVWHARILHRPYLSIAWLVALLGVPMLTLAQTTTRYVSTTGTNTNPATATSWATSTTDLQGAINSLIATGGQVWVAAGTYKPGGNTNTDRTISFSMANGVAIYGGFAGGETTLAGRPAVNPITGNPSGSILSGDLGTVGDNSDNSYNVIINGSDVSLDNTAVLDGFVITGGNNENQGGAMYNFDSSPTLTNCSFQNNTASIGGAMYNNTSSPTLTNCLLQSNTAFRGGAMYNDGSFSGTSSPTLTNCSFLNNSAGAQGGAMYNDGYNSGISSPTLINCSFQGNTGSAFGGAIANNGDRGGNASPTLTKCSFLNNAGVNGGAMATGSGGSPTLDNCLFQGNQGTNGGAIYQGPGSLSLTNCSFQGNIAGPFNGTGGAMYTLGSLTLTNCSFQGNSGVSFAGALYSAGSALLTNCSFQNNSCPFAGSGSVINNDGGMTLINSVFFGNDGANTFSSRNALLASYCLFEAGVTGFTDNGNNITGVTTSPFAATASTQLSACSPAINKGSNAAYTNAGGPATDLAGNPRFFNGSLIDMGAYEFQGTPSFPLAITTQPAAGSAVCVGSTVTASVSVSGTVSGYQWYNASGSVAGQTTATLSLSNVQTTDAGSYSAVVTGACNSVTSTAFSLTVNIPPSMSIAASPSATITQGNPVTLTASGASSYTWSTGVSNSPLTVNPITTTVYSVTGSDGTCSGVSSITITTTAPPCGSVIYVTQSGAGSRNGSSWDNALASTQLQVAIDAAANCGGSRQVWVATGMYTPTTTTDRTISFAMRNGVAIYGGFVGIEQNLSERPAINPGSGQPSSTTLSGDIGTVGNTSDNSYHIISNRSLNNTAVLDGFVLTGGNANDIITFQNKIGGAIFNGGSGSTSSPTLTNCSFLNNSANYGGAMYNDGTTGGNSSPKLTNCAFLNNSATNAYGGAMYNDGNGGTSSPTLTNCSFQANSASSGGAMFNYGNAGTSSPTLTNCSFLNNSATNGSGGAMFNYGGGTSSPTLTNCSFQANSASSGGTMFNSGGGTISPVLTNCILFGNGEANSIVTSSSAVVTASYSLFESGVTGLTDNGNNLTGVTTSPFASTASTQLSACSPAINTGSNAAYTSAGGPTTDLAGNPRFYNSGQIDRGAYEYQGDKNQLVITANPSLTINSGQSTTLTAQGADGYVWSTGQTTASISVSVAGPYSVTGTSSGCSNTATVTVSVSVAPTPSILAGPATGTITACQGTASVNVQSFTVSASNLTVALVATAPVGFEISSSSGSGFGGSVSLTPTSGSVASTTLYVRSSTTASVGSISGNVSLTSSGATSQIVAVSGTVNAVPVVTATANPSLTINSGQSTTLTAQGADGYRWSTGETTASISVSVAGPYSVTGTSSGCSSSTSVTVQQRNCQTTITPSVTQLCVGQSLSLTALTQVVQSQSNRVGPTYNWLAPAGMTLSSTTGSVVSATATTSGVKTFTVNASTAEGCTSTGTVSVTVNALPTVSLSNNGPLSCTLTSVTLTASGGTSYSFSAGATQIGTTNQATVSTAGVYSVTVANASGCTSTTSTTVTSVTAVVTVTNPATTTATVGSPFSQTFTASGGSGPFSYSLASGTLPTGLTLTTTGVLSGTPTQSGSFSITVQATNADGCVGTGSVYPLTVIDPTPTITGLAATPNPVCAGSPATFTAIIGNITTSYSYTLSNGTAPLTGNSSNGAFSQNVTASGSGVQTYTLTVSSGGSLTTATTSLTVNALPSVSLSGPNVCAGQPVTLSATSGLSSYTFTGASGLISNGTSNTASVGGLAAGSYSFTVAATNASGCTSTATTSTTVNALPSATLTNNGPLSCTLTSVTLTAGGGTSYSFSTGATQIGSSNQATVSTAGVYSVTVANASGCTSTTSTTVASVTAVVMVTNPATTTATQGNPFSQTFTAAGGSGPFSFSLASGTLPAGLSLATTGVLSGTPTQIGSFSVTVRATNANGCTGVGPVYILTVRSARFTVTQAPASQTACVGGTVTFSVRVTPSTGVSYAWYKNSADPFQPILATTPDYVVSVTDGSKAGKYIVRVTGGDGVQVEQREATLTVNQRPVPPPMTSTMRQLCPSTSPVNLGQFVSRTNTSYTVRYFDASGKLLSSPNVVLNQPGSYPYTATQLDPATGCESLPTAFTLTVNPTTKIVTSPASQTVCSGSNAVLSVVATGSNLKYEWFKGSISNVNKLSDNPTKQTGTTTASLTLVKVSTTDNYYVRVTGDCGVVSSSAVRVTVRNCGARIGAERGPAEEDESVLTVTVLGNPTQAKSVPVVVTGGGGSSLRFVVRDVRGGLVSEAVVEEATATHRQEVVLGSAGGVYVLEVSSPGQRQTVKIIRQ